MGLVCDGTSFAKPIKLTQHGMKYEVTSSHYTRCKHNAFVNGKRVWSAGEYRFFIPSSDFLIGSSDGQTWATIDYRDAAGTAMSSYALHDGLWCPELNKLVLFGERRPLFTSDLCVWEYGTVQAPTSDSGEDTTTERPGMWAGTWSPQLSKFVTMDMYCLCGWHSPDAVAWSAVNPTFTLIDLPMAVSENPQLEKMVWSPSLGLFVAVGMRGQRLEETGSARAAIYTSSDGIAWAERFIEDKAVGQYDNRYTDVVWVPTWGMFIAVGGGSYGVPVSASSMRSYDGINWEPAGVGIADTLTWSPPLDMVVAARGGVSSLSCRYSHTGLSWLNGDLSGATGAGARSRVVWNTKANCFLVGAAFRLRVSTDGHTWGNGSEWTIHAPSGMIDAGPNVGITYLHTV